MQIENMIAEDVEKWKISGRLPDNSFWVPDQKLEVKGATVANRSAGSDDTHG